MGNFLTETIPYGLWILAVIEYLFIIILLGQYGDKQEDKTPLLMALVSFSVCFEILVSAFGLILPADSSLLLTLSRISQIFYYVLIPVFLPLCILSANGGFKSMTAALVLSMLLMLVGLTAGCAVELVPVRTGAVVRYVYSYGADWLDIITECWFFAPMLLLLLFGFIALFRRKNIHLFTSGILLSLCWYLGIITGAGETSFMLLFTGKVIMTLFFILFVGKNHSDMDLESESAGNAR